MLTYKDDYLMHYGIKGQKKGRRRFQNPDGSLTAAGRLRYSDQSSGRNSGSFIKVQEGDNRPKNVIGSTNGVKIGSSVVINNKAVKNAAETAMGTAIITHLGKRYGTSDYDEIKKKTNEEFRNMKEYREYNETGKVPKNVKRAVEKVVERNANTSYSVAAPVLAKKASAINKKEKVEKAAKEIAKRYKQTLSSLLGIKKKDIESDKKKKTVKKTGGGRKDETK